MPINRKQIRPAVPFRWTKRDVLLEAIGFAAIILYWGVLLLKSPGLADRLPTHVEGIDDVASDAINSTLPKVASVLYALMTLLAFFPRYFNYGVVEITEENAEKEYRSVSTFIRYLKLTVLIIFMIASLTIV